MANILEIYDKSKRKIYLPNERYKHIVKHPETNNKLIYIEEAVKSPDFIEESLNKEKLYYYKYIKKERKYLMVVVKLINGEGKILTAYLIEK